METDQYIKQLVEYITQHLAAGYSESSIRQALTQHGWSQQHVDEAFAVLRETQAQQYATTTVNQPGASQQHGTVAPKKYKLFQAIGDSMRSISKNPGVFAGVTAISLLTGGIIYFAPILLIMMFAFPIMSVILTGSIGTQVLTAVALAVVMLCAQSLAQSVVMMAPALVLRHGLAQEKARFKDVCSYAARSLFRVFRAALALELLLYGPLFLLLIVAITTGLIEPSLTEGLSMFLFIGSLANFAWTIIILLRYGLAPYVALFEKVSIGNALKRSSYLLQRGGQWFLVKGTALVLLISVIASMFTSDSSVDTLTIGDVFALIVTLVLVVSINVVAVALYNNRQAVKG